MKQDINITIIIFSLLLFACNKKDSAPAGQSQKSQLLTSGSWTLTAVIADEDGNGSYENDRFASFPACYTDNYYTFRSNGNLELNEGPSKCDPADPQTDGSSWRLTQNETHLVFGTDEYMLEELTASTLKWKEEYSNGRSAIATFTKR
jgi:Lipocalin-like domain